MYVLALFEVVLLSVWVSKELVMKQNDRKQFSSLLCSLLKWVSSVLMGRCSDVNKKDICMVMRD